MINIDLPMYSFVHGIPYTATVRIQDWIDVIDRLVATGSAMTGYSWAGCHAIQRHDGMLLCMMPCHLMMPRLELVYYFLTYFHELN